MIRNIALKAFGGMPISCLVWPPEKRDFAVTMRSPFRRPPSTMSAPAPEKPIPISHRAMMGGMAGMIATCLGHPLDLVKIRMQLFPCKRTTYQMLRRVHHCEGVRGLYSGLTAALLRQASYTTKRLAVYATLYENYQAEHGVHPNAGMTLGIALVAGVSGALAGTPSEVALIRMTMKDRRRRSPCSPSCSPACKMPWPRRTWGAVGKIYTIASRDGIRALWRGGWLTSVRSLFVSAAQVGTYAKISNYLEDRRLAEGTRLHLCASIWSSAITAVMSLPIDIVKTTYQANMRNETMNEICQRLLRESGFKRFWRGLLPYYARLVIHTSLSFIFLEHITTMYKDLRTALKYN